MGQRAAGMLMERWPGDFVLLYAPRNPTQSPSDFSSGEERRGLSSSNPSDTRHFSAVIRAPFPTLYWIT